LLHVVETVVVAIGVYRSDYRPLIGQGDETSLISLFVIWLRCRRHGSAGCVYGRAPAMVTLLFAGLIVSFVLLDLVVIRRIERRASLPGTGHEHPAPTAVLELVLPRSYFFHPGHAWARIEETGEVTVGTDDLVQSVLGAVERVEPPRLGQRVEADEPAFSLGRQDRCLTLESPLSGKVTSLNEELVERPGLVNEDPYGDGWVFRLEPDPGPVRELARLVIGRKAATWMRGEVDRVGHLATAHGSGGSPAGLLERAGGDLWRAIQRDVLRCSPKG
jgi:glycine cleavage system H lipoate-binding protein